MELQSKYKRQINRLIEEWKSDWMGSRVRKDTDLIWIKHWLLASTRLSLTSSLILRWQDSHNHIVWISIGVPLHCTQISLYSQLYCIVSSINLLVRWGCAKRKPGNICQRKAQWWTSWESVENEDMNPFDATTWVVFKLKRNAKC